MDISVGRLREGEPGRSSSGQRHRAAGEGALTRRLLALLVVLGVCAGGAIHFQTPMLGEMGREFRADAASVGWVPTLAFGGFLVGNLFLMPLGDRFDKRRLLLVELSLLVLSLLWMAAAPSLAVLAAGSLATGFFATVVMHLMAVVGDLSSPAERGRAAGTVLSGVYLGILFGRLAGGLVATHLGWRWMYAISAATLLALVPALVAWLPGIPAKTDLSYAALLRSLVRLLRTSAELRRATTIQLLLGICYGAFWATLAQMLKALHGLGPTAAGLIGLPGAAGVLIARPAGRWVDRSGRAPVVTCGACLVLCGYLSFGLAGVSLLALVVGAVLQDCGLRSTLVASHALASGIDPHSRSRSITVLAAHVWAGNAAGGFIGSTAWGRGGWGAVVASGVCAALLALLLQLRSARLSPAPGA